MKPFKFKQFSVLQDRCAMKIGTDGVLLGAWTSLVHQPCTILDIGAGTGIIALMLGQRSDAELIDSIELDEDAYEQCVENFEASPWGDRLFCYHAGLDEFVDEIEEQYDLIVSNPPFYTEEVSSKDISRDIARQNSSLPFDELIDGVSKLLAPKGVFSMIAPFKEQNSIIDLASKVNLFPQRITQVQGNPQSGFKRVLLEFTSTEKDYTTNTLVIEKARHDYSKEYIDLTREFYLKM